MGKLSKKNAALPDSLKPKVSVFCLATKIESIENLSLPQKSAVATQIIPDTNDAYLLGSLLTFGFLVQPSMDLRRLERVIEKLVKRHDTLRQTFAYIDDKWKIQVWDKIRNGFKIEDYGDVDDHTFNRVLDHHSLRPIKIATDDLFQIIVAKFGKRGDVLIIRASHCNTDGHSLIILTEELLMLLIGLPLMGRPMSHRQYIDEFEKPTQTRVSAVDAYWRSLLFPALPSPTSGKFGTGTPAPRRHFDASHFVEVQYSLSADELNKLQRSAASKKTTLFFLIFAAFAKSYLQLSGLPGLYVTTAIDRIDKKLNRQIACLAGSIPLRCEFGEGASIEAMAKILSTQLVNSLEHLPSEAMLPELRYDHEIFKAGGVLKSIYCAMILPEARVKKSPFASSILSRNGTPQKLGPLKITKLNLPVQATSPSALSVLLKPTKATMDLIVEYQSHLFSTEDIARLVKRFEKNLNVTFAEMNS